MVRYLALSLSCHFRFTSYQEHIRRKASFLLLSPYFRLAILATLLFRRLQVLFLVQDSERFGSIFRQPLAMKILGIDL